MVDFLERWKLKRLAKRQAALRVEAAFYKDLATKYGLEGDCFYESAYEQVKHRLDVLDKRIDEIERILKEEK